MRVLAIDDEEKITQALTAYLEHQGMEVQTARSGEEGLAKLDSGVGLVLLDLMLPDMPGEAVCQRIRAQSDVPIIMLTAKTQEEDTLSGFGLGADDYVKKPFSLKELYARMQAILRRRGTADGCVSVGDLTVDPAAQRLCHGRRRGNYRP